MSALPEPHFVDRDPVDITRDLISAYEAMSGRALLPAQVERLLVDLLAYSETLVRIAIQETAKQNMVAYATGVNLDHLGALLGVVRLPARPAAVTVQASLAAASDVDVTVPAGTRIKSRDGAVIFRTTRALVIAAGAIAGEVEAVASEVGEAGNGYLPGDIATVMDPVPGVAIENATTSYGGAAVEDDERLRARVQEAPERFTVAGSRGAYRWHVMSAHQSLVDAGVISPTPGVVQLYPLGVDGIPAPEILDLVTVALSAEKTRPMTDKVEVLPPTEVPYALSVELTLLRGADQASVEAAAATAAARYAADRRNGLGRDLIHAQIIAALSVPGVYDVTVLSPEERVLDGFEWANATSINIAVVGVADG
ncbi:baseplate J/gp47 family protein [Roseospira visakhapatnamensis]|uniref:Phage-related baseplate assembly protein n=1 Tax=Roseospira visakhapatnamensis TaxID=390880 RepID=A0A7W6WBV9_9PROT|nr:phage-related baseplate assembly protein [Roseospira visakhapatnamensis]